MKVKDESVEAGFTLDIQKTKIMVTRPIAAWQIDGETIEIETLFSWAPNGDCSPEIKRCSLEEKLWQT